MGIGFKGGSKSQIARSWEPDGARWKREAQFGIPAKWRAFDPVIFMAIVTPIYLLFEFAFNAALLNTTGTIVSNSDIQNIEHWGRAISGVALALFIWGFFLSFAQKKALDLRLVISGLLVTLVASIAFTFQYEKVLLDGQVHHNHPAELRLAYQIQIVEHEVMGGRLKLDGLPPDFDPHSAAAKSFFSIFPFMARDVKDFSKRARPELIQVIKNRITDGNTRVAAANLYNTTIYKADQKVVTLYRDYVQAERRRADAINHASSSAEASWRSLETSLRNEGTSTTNVPFAEWGQVRNHVLAQGVNVPPGWDPANKAIYMSSAEAHIDHLANRDFNSASSHITGNPLAIGMSFMQFSDLPSIVATWRKSLKLKPGQDIGLSPTTDYQAWKQQYYAPILEKQINKRIHQIEQPISAFDEGGPLYQRGVDAMRAMLAPPMALCFSILGALIHIYKSGKYMLLVKFRHTERQTRIVKLSMLVVAMVIGFLPFSLPNGISRSPLFTTLVHDARKSGSISAQIDCTGIAWVVQAQPYFYPMNDVFNRALGGIGFQYSKQSIFANS